MDYTKLVPTLSAERSAPRVPSLTEQSLVPYSYLTHPSTPRSSCIVNKRKSSIQSRSSSRTRSTMQIAKTYSLLHRIQSMSVFLTKRSRIRTLQRNWSRRALKVTSASMQRKRCADDRAARAAQKLNPQRKLHKLTSSNKPAPNSKHERLPDTSQVASKHFSDGENAHIIVTTASLRQKDIADGRAAAFRRFRCQKWRRNTKPNSDCLV